MNSKKLLHRDFILVVIGQIISLFGNAILRFALPLYLLNQTQSPALFGIVSACSFVPMILLSPIGGIVADRINKRNIMVVLDFLTAILTLVFSFLLGNVNLVILMLVTLIILYGIQGAYQPAVQASIPALVNDDDLMPANAIINAVTSLANLIGPVIGGAVFGFFGLTPILYISIVCFFISAIMEMFIHIPFERKKTKLGIFKIAKEDMKEGFSFIKNENPLIGKISLIVAGINLFLSTLIIIGLPVIVTQLLGFSEQQGNQFYGYAQGILAAGGLIGGLLAGVIGNKLKVEKSYILLLSCSLTLLPIGIVLMLPVDKIIAYLIIVISCFVMMVLSSLFTIQMMAYLQFVTPKQLIGKIMAFAMCIAMCAQPVGQAIYGTLIQFMSNEIYILFFGATIICLFIGILSKKSFKNLYSVNNKV